MKFIQKIRAYGSPQNAIFSYTKEGKVLIFVINVFIGMFKFKIGGSKLVRAYFIKY